MSAALHAPMEIRRRAGYTALENAIFDDEEYLTVYDKMVYWALCRFADRDTMQSWPSRATIAKKCRFSVDMVDRSIKNLVNHGLLHVQKRKQGTKYLPSVYTLLEIPEKFKKNQGVADDVGQGEWPIPTARVADDSGQVADDSGQGSRCGRQEQDPLNKIHLTNKTTTPGNWLDVYFRAFGSFPSGLMVERVNSFIEDGIEEEVVCLILEKAGSVGAKPSYVTKVLNEWYKAGIRTKDQALQDMQHHEDRNKARLQNGRRNPDRSKDVLYSSEELGF